MMYRGIMLSIILPWLAKVWDMSAYTIMMKIIGK